MYWRAEKALIEYTVKTFRRIFAYAPDWLNKDLEVVQLSSGSKGGDIIFEQYNEEPEKYPRITVGGVGGTWGQLAFNDIINTYDADTYSMGSRTMQQVYINGSSSVAVSVPSGAYQQSLRGVFVNASWTGLDYGNDPLQVFLYKNYTTSPVLVSSGSFGSLTNLDLAQFYTEMYPLIALTDTDYWLVYQAATGSSYYVAIDPTTAANYVVQGTPQSGSVVSSLLFPAFLRIGGAFDGTLQLQCQAKNDNSLPRNLAEIVSQYFEYLKHAQVSRNSSTDVMQLVDENVILIDEWLSKGVRIKQVREGALIVRPRGDSDKIFTIPVTVDYFTEWFEDFPLNALDNINITIEEFWDRITANLIL